MRVGIIGCGHVSDQHIRQLRKMQRIEFAGVCDVEHEKAKLSGRRYGIADVYQDVSKFLNEKAPQVVHILTPPQSHKELSIHAMESGCHVLVEKPMAMNTCEAEEMIGIARKRGVILTVCHNFLFVPVFLEARNLVEKGALGRVVSAEVFWRISSQGASDRYNTFAWIHELPGGIFHEVAAHPVYLLAALLGKLEVVSAISKNLVLERADKGDELKVLFDSETGLGVLSISLSAKPVQKFLRIYGTEMTLHVDLTTNTLLKLRPRGAGVISRALVNVDQSSQLIAQTFLNSSRVLLGRLPRGHETFISSFYAGVENRNSPPVTGEEGLAVITVLDRIWTELGLTSTLPGNKSQYG